MVRDAGPRDRGSYSTGLAGSCIATVAARPAVAALDRTGERAREAAAGLLLEHDRLAPVGAAVGPARRLRVGEPGLQPLGKVVVGVVLPPQRMPQPMPHPV